MSNSKDHYVHLLEEVETHSICGHDSEIPHYFERAWVEIFCKNNVSKMFHNDETYGEIDSIKNNPNTPF